MSQNQQKLSENNPVQATIGTLVYDEVVSIAINIQGVKTADMATSQTVANNHVPIAVTDHAKETIVTVTIDAHNVLGDLINKGYVNPAGANAFLGTFEFKERNISNQTRTVSFVGNNSKIQSVEGKLVSKDNPVTEIKILTFGAITFSAWT